MTLSKQTKPEQREYRFIVFYTALDHFNQSHHMIDTVQANADLFAWDDLDGRALRELAEGLKTKYQFKTVNIHNIIERRQSV